LVEANLKNYDQAASYGVEAVNFNVENKNVFGELISRLNLGDAYRLKRDFTKAEDQMQQSLALAKKVKFQEGIQENYITYSQLLEDKGEYSKALSYYKKFTALKDSLSGTEVKNKINELEIKYET